MGKGYVRWFTVLGVVALLLAATWASVAALSQGAPSSPEEGEMVARWGKTPELSPSLAGVKLAAVTPWTLPEQAWRIGVTADGLYRLTRESLVAAGVPLTTPWAYHVWWRGEEVALDEVGLADGVWDVGDGFVFYGEKFKGSTQDEKYTDENVYWLTLDGGSWGKRMETRGVAGTAEGAVGLCRTETRLEENLVYWARWSEDPGTETNWFWERVTGSSTKPVTKTYTVNLNAEVSSGGEVELEIEFAAGQEVYSLNPDHHVRVLVNGVVVGDVYWDGVKGIIYQASFPVEVLRSGSNTLQWVIMNDPGMGAQVIYFDRAVLRYPGRPGGSACERLGSASSVYTFTGYSAMPGVYDVGMITESVRLTGYGAEQSGGVWTVRWREAIAAARYAVGVPAVITPTEVTVRTGAVLSPTQGADYVIVVPGEWEQVVAPLAVWRAGQGLRVKVVRIEDVYALFNGGVVHPRAVAEFVRYAYEHWPGPSLQMVFLIGDGDFNPKGYNPGVYGEKKRTWIVPYLQFVDPDQGEVPTDAAYGDVNGDGYAEVAIGRLPAEGEEEVVRYIEKVLAYEGRGAEAWQMEALLIADDGSTYPEPFKQLLERVHNRYAPGNVVSRTVYAEAYCGAVDTAPCPEMTRAITREWNTGQGVVVYSGHGAVYRWGHEPLILNREFASVTETEKLPVLISLDCWDGYWMFPSKYHSWPGNSYRSVGEWVTTVLTDRGAVAAFGPAGLAYPSVQEVMLDAMWRGLYREGEFQMGKLVQRGWYAIRGSYLARTYTLLGDPGLWLPYWQGVMAEPAALEVAAGSVVTLSERLTVTGETRFGQTLNVTDKVKWRADRGEVDAYGVWQAPTSVGGAQVQAQLGMMSAMVPVTIVPAAPVTLTVSPNPVVLIVGEQVTLSTALQDAYSNAWSVTAESWSTDVGEIDAQGRFTAPVHPATGWLTATYGSFVTRVLVQIGSGEPARLVVTPETLTMTVGQTHVFTAHAEDEYGNRVALPAPLSWSADSGIGTITAEGLLTARTVPASGYVRAQSGAFSAQASVMVVPGPSVTVEVTPDTLELYVGMTATLQARALDVYGNVTLDPIAWQSSIGLMDSSGRFTAPTHPGTGAITVTAGAVQRVVPVTVLAGPPASLVLSPDRAVVRVLERFTFNLEVYDRYGNRMQGLSPRWEADCGSVDAQGVYQAPAHPCQGEIRAILGDLQASAQVEVRSVIFLPLTLRNASSPTILTWRPR